MKYKTINKEDVFIQNGTNNVKFLMLKKNSNQFVINTTGEIIVNKILENTDTKDVLAEIRELYPDVEKNILLRDIEDMINVLTVFGVIINLDCKKLDSVNTSVLGETEYQIACNMISKNIDKNKLNMGMPAAYYTAINIRSKIMNNNEYFYKYVGEDGELLALMSVIPNFQTSTVIVSSLIFDENIKLEQAVCICNDMLAYIKSNMINHVNKMRIILTAEEKKLPMDFIELISACTFKLETTLEKEVNNENTYFYTIKYV